ncbi:MAG: hypothetical protein ACOC3I_09280, partial [Verrucomicrobiota bacterium]
GSYDDELEPGGAFRHVVEISVEPHHEKAEVLTDWFPSADVHARDRKEPQVKRMSLDCFAPALDLLTQRPQE